MSKQLAELNEKIDLLLNKKQVFLRGVIRGVGIAIGTTIVAAVVLAILSAIFRTVDLQNAPVIKDVIESSETR